MSQGKSHTIRSAGAPVARRALRSAVGRTTASLPRRAALGLALLAVAGLAAGGLARGVRAAEEPTRVAVLLPFVGDALAEVPEDAQVVATVRRSLHQAPRGDAADLGNPHSPSLEVLAAANPELVVGDAQIHAALAEPLGRTGAEVMLLETSSVEETFAGLRRLGARVGAAEALDAAVARAEARLETLRLAEPRPTLVLFGAPGSFFAMSERTWLGDLAAQLGLENVVGAEAGSERFPGLVPLSDERVATLRPEVVLLVTHGDPGALQEAFARRLEQGPWQSVREAARVQRVLDPRHFAANPGLGLPEAAEALLEAARGAGAGPAADASREPDPDAGPAGVTPPARPATAAGADEG